MRRLFGSAPEALAAGARALVALSANGSPRDVAISVLGVPPSHTVIPWQDATIGGFALTRRLDEPVRRTLAARIARLSTPSLSAGWKEEGTMLTEALFVRLEAKPGKEDAVEKFLKEALPVVEAERTTPAWFAIRMGPSTFAIFDAFPTRRGGRLTSRVS